MTKTNNELTQIIWKFNEWKEGRNIVHLSNSEVLFLLDYFNDLADKLAPLARYSIAMEAASRDAYDLRLIARARGLK